MPRATWSSMWDLAAAQAQMEAISAALMPFGVAPSGRLQVPSVEVQETADTVVVTAFLPGAEPQAVQVRATARSLTFWGQRPSAQRNSLGLDLTYFQQTVPLPTAVQDRHMQVAYQQGAIVVTLPKVKGFWSRWVGPQSRDWGEGLSAQGQRLNQGWRQLKNWLGYQLRQWSDRLLADR